MAHLYGLVDSNVVQQRSLYPAKQHGAEEKDLTTHTSWILGKGGKGGRRGERERERERARERGRE